MRQAGGFLGIVLLIGSGSGSGVACAGHSTGPQAGPAQGGSAGQASATSYVPSEDVPFNADYLKGGSFEGQQGYGWDTCPTRTSGVVTLREDPASDGSAFFGVESAEACTSPCAPDNESDAQFGLWFADEGSRPAPGAGLYFDLINRAPTPPTATLQLYAIEGACVTRRLLAAIPLQDLDLSSRWSTRCVALGLMSPENLGVAVQGSSFNIGIDALRFGPACQ